jgi:hypothetical protein
VNGQWVSSYEGPASGRIIVNIDERELNYQGVAYLLPKDNTFPGSGTYFRTVDKSTDFKFRTDRVLPIDPTSGLFASWGSIKHHYPQIATFSNYADAFGSWNETSLKLSWKSDTGDIGESILPRSKADQPSEIGPLEMDWTRFKTHVSTLKARKFLFRGQNGQWRLRTSFHRTGRADIDRFLREDIQVLHKHLSARTKHTFNLQNPDENGAFFNLVQHHGYPTPLLDWTYSPYVAAFFAYRGISNEKASGAKINEKVRIHVFDQAQWAVRWQQILLLPFPGLHLSIGEFIAIENERMIPQQAATTVTNIDDIESYIKSKESNAEQYLSTIDLPVRDRSQVVRDLSYMGITAGSLFPGLDGACEELRERNFLI